MLVKSLVFLAVIIIIIWLSIWYYNKTKIQREKVEIRNSDIRKTQNLLSDSFVKSQFKLFHTKNNVFLHARYAGNDLILKYKFGNLRIGIPVNFYDPNHENIQIDLSKIDSKTSKEREIMGVENFLIYREFTINKSSQKSIEGALKTLNLVQKRMRSDNGIQKIDLEEYLQHLNK